jgi:hypothetical protein
MKVSLIALIAGCAMAGSAFAMMDSPPSSPPRATVMDSPPSSPPRAVVMDSPPSSPPRAAFQI